MKNALLRKGGIRVDDEYYTPRNGIIPLLKYIPQNVKTIWEPTDFGGSLITEQLKKAGYKVISTHIQNFDFLKDTPNFDYDAIITNPPYSKKNEFLSRCYALDKPFALLLPITALEGIERGKQFKNYGIDIVVLNKRLAFSGKNNWFNTSWFTHKFKSGIFFEEVANG